MNPINHRLQLTKRRNVTTGSSTKDLELQRLAEFGRVSASLIHDMSSPLTAAAITLDQVFAEQPNKLIKQASRDLRQLERYVIAAKHQLTGDSVPTSFSLTIAIHQVIMLLSSRPYSESSPKTMGLSRSSGRAIRVTNEHLGKRIPGYYC